ncbi:hypothetical protein HCU74_11175 [Spongiibacter sp. KMU-166]|uniref:GH29D-like beta-sandwich domain-containing protein n=1 Tax=Spongiibacter thalassae TaxID=2721624 RepID=A0ABX1GFL9_9GAMM|nr:chitobiase/beta-hexosaminidase C-terminal domain-containing protein [Spongiibacter thalassae]NKI17968.1 hypothetical protein [Spongiibacter thalassae]
MLRVLAEHQTSHQALSGVYRRWQIWCLWGLTLLCQFAMPVAAAENEAVCATVKIDIQQELTFERQGFEAHMRINNALDTLALENVTVDVYFSDANGDPVFASSDPNSSSASFFITVRDLENIDSVSSGTIAASASADVRWLIVPAPGAAVDAPAGVRYFVGATLSYVAGGKEESIEVVPDSILVKPMPRLTLDYFLPREVHGDDAFTQEIERAEPYTLGVRVLNNGQAAAKNVKIESAQPRIVENEQGLLVGFEILGSFVNDQRATPSLLLNFGDIAASGAAMGRWNMSTSLSGQFTEFEASFSHSDELGGSLTSLVEATNTHWLIHDVRVDLPGRDAVRDFLADEGEALIVYESNGTATSVVDHSSGSSMTLTSSAAGLHTFELQAPAEAGLSYIQLPDPSNGTLDISNMVRADGKSIDSANVWLSRKRNADGVAWDYFINVFDAATSGHYEVVMAPRVVESQAPSLAFIGDKTTYEGGQSSFIVQASDSANQPISLSVFPLPPGATFVDQGEGGGQFTWFPQDGQAGVYEMQFSADNGELQDTRTVRITVYPWWDPDGSLTAQSEEDENSQTEDPANGAAIAGFPVESGTAAMGESWEHIPLQQSFTRPVLILGTASETSPAPGLAQAQSLRSDGVQLRFQQWPDLPEEDAEESVPYLVMEAGRYRLMDNSVWEVGTIDVAGANTWQAFEFHWPFAGTPEVFLTLQSANGDLTLVRARNVSAQGFELALLPQNASEEGDPVLPERVGYLAILPPDTSPNIDFEEGSHTYELAQLTLAEGYNAFAEGFIHLQAPDEITTLVTEQGSALSLDGMLFSQLITDHNHVATFLRDGAPRVAPVSFSLASGTYTTEQSVTFATDTEEAEIRYTTDGSDPTETSTLYTDALTLPLNSTTELKAKAFKSRWRASELAHAHYVITGTVATPVTSVAPGTYSDVQYAELSADPTTAEIRYTVDGSDATSTSMLYTGPIELPLNSEITLRARAFQTDWVDSEELVASYTITGTVDAPTYSLAPGIYTSEQLLDIATTTPDADIRYTLDGSEPGATSTPYSSAIALPLDSTITLRAKAFKTDWVDSATTDATYVITGTVAAPTFSLEEGLYTTAQTVTLSTATANADIRFTTDGSEPTAGSALYTGAIDLPLDSHTTLRAKAFRADWVDSVTSQASYQITGTVATPTFSLEAGLYTTAQTVELGTATANAEIRYTTDGSEPTAESALYTSAIALPLDSSTTLRVKAFRTDWIDSGTAEASYVITGTVSAPEFSLDAGLYTTAQVVTLSTSTANTEIRYTTDGSTPSAHSPLYTGAIDLPLDSTTTLRARAFRTDWVDSATSEATYVITGTVATPTFSLEAGLYTTAQTVELSTATANAEIRYTTDGSEPTTTSTLYSGAIELPLDSTTTLRVKAFREDWVDSARSEASYVITGTVATPGFSLDEGLYMTAQAVELTTATANADIRYTTDGTEPTATSLRYTEAILLPLDSTTTIRAKAFREDWVDSAFAEATYVITGTVATPVFSLEAGLYTSAQGVELSTATSSAEIRYTTDGSEPTVTSTLYSDTIELPLDSTTTLRVKAFRDDWVDSLTAEATYVITGTVATPTFSLPAGSYTTEQTVALSTTTANADIRYTLDGSEPNESSARYTDPLSLAMNTTTVLTVRAYRTDWIASESAADTYYVYPPISVEVSPEFEASGGQLPAGDTLLLTPQGGSGNFSVEAFANPQGMTGLLVDEGGGGYSFMVPNTGAFAGYYDIYVTDQETGDVHSFSVAVPFGVHLSPTTLLGRVGEATVVVTGATAGENMSFEILDGNGNTDSYGDIAIIDATAVATDNAQEANPATVGIDAADVIQREPFRAKVIPESSHLYVDAYSEVGEVEPALTYRGEVVTSAGNPVSNALIAVQNLQDAHGEPYAARTDTDGLFEFAAPKIGSDSHTLRIEADGYATIDRQGSDCEAFDEHPACMVVVDPDPQSSRPLFSPSGGTYNESTSVVIQSDTTDATIRYTLDGTTPTRFSGIELSNGGSVHIDINRTLTAIAYTPTRPESEVTVAEYAIRAAKPTMSTAEGLSLGTIASISVSPTVVTVHSDTENALIRYTLDGSDPTPTHGFEIANGESFELHGPALVKVIAFRADMTESEVTATLFVAVPNVESL